VEFGVLGLLQVQDGGAAVSIGPGKESALLALLLLHRNEPVSPERVGVKLWATPPPASSQKSVQQYVSRLRRRIGAGRLTTTAAGYVLHTEPDELDAERFDRLAGEGRAALENGDAAVAERLFSDALALWRGPALADFRYEDFAQGEIRRLEAERRWVVSDRVNAMLALGREEFALPELEGLIEADPLWERPRAQLMLALYRAGRQSEALDVFQQTRALLDREVGLAPGNELQELQRAILNQDPAIGGASPAPAGASRSAAVGAKPRARATIRDVAGVAGVSIATVSRVLNGRPDVAPATRDMVLQAVRELRFTAARSARSLSGGRTHAVGITLPLVEAEYFSRILAGAIEELYEHDLQVVLAPTLHLRERAKTVLGQLTSGTTDGAVLIMPEQSRDELDALLRSGYPFVIADPLEILHEGIPTVSSTNAHGGRLATEHLLSLGHRRIGVVTGIPDWLASLERLNGYRAALAAAGIAPDPSLVVEADWAFAGGEAAASVLLDGPDPPTAIFAFNDNMAVGVLRAAQARGLRIPEDISVVGFDDLDHAATVTPALTTVSQPLGEMGRVAVSLLIRLLEREPQPIPRLASERRRPEAAIGIELQTKLIVRSSTAIRRK
jgi:LacI family transcriptional regulator